MTVLEALRAAGARLAASGVGSADLDAALILARVLGVERHRLRTEPGRLLVPAEESEFERLVAGRAHRRPLAQILGRREFRSLDFEVTSDVLTPRPETELLVDVAVKSCDRAIAEGRAPLVVDVGTGSGCIAVAVGVERPAARVLATESSGPALDVARRNVARHGVGNRVTLHRGDLLAPAAAVLAKGSVDAIVSNPPYVRRSEAGTCDPEVLWEPACAVFCDGEPASLFARIAGEAWPLLRPGGVLALETSDLSLAEAEDLLARMCVAAGGAVADAREVREHGGRPRVVVLRR